MEGTYEVTEDEIEDEFGRIHKTFGIRMISADGEPLETFESVFFDETSAREFVKLCNSEALELGHLSEVLEDIL